ncbi:MULTISPECIES: ABC transporter substrate-binding protein [Rhodococcus]|uniref:ABC-type nitrate/sulfonate/bicarbonate transport system substrate-binding protein n=2 Tax=Rhodococcus rhodochrous TaxID=1829 RepID=A0A562E7R8_RHORH|nr:MULTISPECIES: ABC transporter substrate-binding protein [Rhodococcus]MCD2115042.1 ABC transporter substrate-binding protein [Rhodococcus rhodochrous]TWH17743.1 ABC-type nitrate/sulfonate/bicarbonate transport system substrate-binding protein [Rhodococcus rhodochrous J45]WAL47916.1 ABC transporter substrate-binding protein [Rhodococcus pyridinivorans]
MNITNFPRPLKVLALGALASLALTACGGSSDADTAGDGTVRVAVFPSFNALGPRTADLEGVFDKHGLDVELVTVATPGEATPQLLGGKIDFALMDMVSPIIAKTEGVDLVMAAPGAVGAAAKDDGLTSGRFWVRADSPIQSVADLENATFGIPQTKGQLWLDVREAIDNAGGDSSKTEFVEVPNTLAALRSGSVDVVTTAEPSGTATLNDPDLRVLDHFVNAGGDLSYAYVTTPRYAAENAENVEKFRDAVVEANTMLAEQDGLAAEVAATYIEVDPAILSQAIYPKFPTTPITEDNIDSTLDRMVRYGLVQEADAPAPGDMIVGG